MHEFDYVTLSKKQRASTKGEWMVTQCSIKTTQFELAEIRTSFVVPV